MSSNHVHKWTSLIGQSYPMGCDCGALLVKDMKVGSNTIALSPSGVGDVIRWSATQAAVAAGDLGMNTTTGRPSAFIGGVARNISEYAANFMTAPGTGYYGSGSDGSPSSPLVANTTLASGDRCVRFTNLDLAGFSLTPNTADRSCVITVSGTLTMNSGSIVAAIGSSAALAGGAGGAGGGAGGTGGQGRWNVYLYARNIVGSGTMHADGTAGGNGVAGVAPTGNVGGTGGSTPVGNNVQFNVQTQAASAAAGAGAAVGGTGGLSRANQTVGARSRNLAKDILRYWYFSGTQINSTADNQRVWESTNGGSGGGGGGRNTAPAGGGGGGSAGSRFIGLGGGTGAGGTGLAGVTGSGGGGGGAGGPGSLIMVISETSTASLTITANGGTAGNGGSANSANGGAGAGAGGSSGGCAIYIGPAGASATVTANGSAAGTGGVTGVAAGASTAGGNGVAMFMARET